MPFNVENIMQMNRLDTAAVLLIGYNILVII